MIRIDSFFLLKGLARFTWEFHDDHLTAKVKSLTIEAEDEIPYERIKYISWSRGAYQDWLFVELILVGAAVLMRWAFAWFSTNTVPALYVERGLVILGLLFLVPAFRRRHLCYFVGADWDYLTAVSVDRRHRAAFADALKLVRQRADLIAETSPDTPLPPTAPVYETIEVDIPDFLSRSTTRSYEDKLIDVETSLLEESTTEIPYSELSGKSRVARMGNSHWDYVQFYWPVLIATVYAFTSLFLPRQIWTSPAYTRIILGGLLLLVPLFLLRFVKSEILLLYNRNDKVIYWTRRSPRNRKTLDQALEFIRSRVAPQSSRA